MTRRNDATSFVGGEAKQPIDPLFGTVERLDPDGALARALGREPNDEELKLWASMPTDWRAKAVTRIGVLRRWVDEPGEMTAAEAAEEIGAAVSRFYEIASAWKANPTLNAVGSTSKPGRKGSRLDGDVVNAIQSVLPKLVEAAGRDAKTSELINKLTEHPKLSGMSLPHANTLRTMIEREKRRVKSETQVGGRPGFDVSVCELLRHDGMPHVLFATIDRTSRIILGFTVGELARSHAAYARAARDALDRIDRKDSALLPWADSTSRIDVIVGDDLDAWTEAKAAYDAAPLGPVFGLVEKGKRYGRYLKIAAGDAIGEMKIHPARTGTELKPTAGNAYTDAEAIAAIEVEVARHNAEIMSNNVATGAPRPAPVTLRMLELIAAGGDVG